MATKKPSPTLRLLSALLTASLLSPSLSLAATATIDKASIMAQFGQEMGGMGGGVSEFSYRGDKDDVLVPVYMLGSISRPGLYHIPLKSELVTALSIAGGLHPDADYDGINIKDSRTGKTEKVSLDELVSAGKQQSHPLLGSEIIFVDKTTPWISNNTTLVIGFISGVLGIIIGSKALSNSK